MDTRYSLFVARCSVLIAVACTAVACHRKKEAPAPVVPVQVSPVIRGSIRNFVTADAILYPQDQANIAPKITAPVRRFLVQRGDHVKRGQLLAELENRDLAAAAFNCSSLATLWSAFTCCSAVSCCALACA